LNRTFALAASLVALIGAAMPARALDLFSKPSTGDKNYTLTAQVASLAPNAGGQEAFSLLLATNEWEAGAFSNQYITAGNKPLTGGFYAWRYPICDDSCWWQAFVETGGGFSTGGPFAQATWGTIFFTPVRYLPAVRIDVTTQVIFIRWRGVTWSYPLWTGISVPF
jgi:hypothetical protein